jgi:CDP-diacylglycerol--serine O-phosphatidyltransferase
LLVTSPLIMYNEAAQEGAGWPVFWGIFCFAVIILAAIFMNLYPIRYVHLGRFMGRHPWFGRLTVLLAFLCVFTPYLGLIAFIYMFLYLLSPLVSWRIPPDIAAKEGSTGSASSRWSQD